MKQLISLILVLSMLVLMSVPIAFADNGNSGRNVITTDEEDDDDVKGNKNFEKFKGLPYGLSKREVLPPGLFNKEVLPGGLARRIFGSEQMTEFYMNRLNKIVEILEERLADEENYLIPTSLENQILAYIAGLENIDTIDEIIDYIILGRDLIKTIDEQRLATPEEIQAFLDIITQVLVEMTIHLEANEGIDETPEWLALVSWLEALPEYEITDEVIYSVLEEQVEALEELVEAIEPPMPLPDDLFKLMEMPEESEE